MQTERSVRFSIHRRGGKRASEKRHGYSQGETFTAGASTERRVRKSWRPFPPRHSVTRQLGSDSDSDTCFHHEPRTVVRFVCSWP
ncbi:Dihydroxy-acid dehydratase 1 [Clarias magur]|uniref:Dihydroxy-acid dehydratase 1 n=1 Tax=Clarias magur TaxID=1594786 RepID=A0A8J4U9L0_CLAMG|nr:Dihydroxy-acid dehydratase 1 [Clarias magur]